MKTYGSFGNERGVAILIVLLVLMALTLAGVGTMNGTIEGTRRSAATTAESRSLFSSDAAVWEGATWMKAQRFLAPPSRVNITSITDSNDENYYAVRNWGGLGDSDSATAADYRATTADGTTGAGGPSYWYRIKVDPNGVVNPTRTAGEEAGVLVTYTYDVGSVSEYLGANQRVDLRLQQTYNLSPYGG